MKRFFIIVVIAMCISGVHSRLSAQWQNLLPKKPTGQAITLFDVSKAFNEYWAARHVEKGFYVEDGVKKKASGWKPFKRAEYFWEQRVNPTTGEFPTTSSVIEFEKSQFHLNKTAGVTSTASWSNMGTNSSTGGYAGLGRLNCVAFHPSDVNTYWVGSPAGGIWKTSNNGSTWTVLNESMSTLGVSDIAVPSDYVTSTTLYIATGDRDGGSLWTLGTGHNADNPSIGVYKSVNGGSTWSQTGLQFTSSGGKLIGRLLIASDNTTLYAATTDGVYKSIDSGTLWTLVLNTGGAYVVDMEFKPGDDNTLYASTMNVTPRIYMTSNAGASWSPVYIASSNDYRIELAVTAADPTYVYAVVSDYATGYNLKSVLQSTNSGASFTVVFDGTVAGHNLLANTIGATGTSGQGWYDLSLAVSPVDKNILLLGGVNTWYSSNGGTSWQIKTMWYSGAGPQAVHADKHRLAFQNGSTLFECNDGGIYRAALANSSWVDPGSNFVDKSNGLVISQIYRIGVSKSDVTKTLAGLQDNGAKLDNNGTWKDVTGGDGMECIIDYSNPLFMYTTYYDGIIYRNTDGFATSTTTTISNNIPGGAVGAWVSPFIIDPTNHLILYTGYDKVWKTANQGTSWIALSGVLSPSNLLRSLAAAPSNSDVMYAADQTHLWKTTNATSATVSTPATWTDITGTLPVASASITYLAVKADDPQTVWVTFGSFAAGKKVYQTTDGGTTWTSISGTLPNVPVLCITQNTRASSAQLFIGTDVGVYAKDGANDWILYNDGMPLVIVTELEFYYGASQAADRLRAATFGRGLWETPVSSVLPVELTKFTAVPKNSTVQLAWTTATEHNNAGFEIERSAGGDTWAKVGYAAGHGNSNAPLFYSFQDSPTDGMKFTYRLKQIDNDGQFKYSGVIEVVMNNPSDFVVRQNYPNPFNPSTTIRYEVPIPGLVSIRLYDSDGREIKTLLQRQEAAGYHEIVFDGSQYASGVYYYSVQSGDNMRTLKMVLMK